MEAFYGYITDFSYSEYTPNIVHQIAQLSVINNEHLSVT